MSEVTVPTGYKNTEVGVIPKDWEVVSLNESVDFLDGQRRPVKSSDRAKINGIYPYYGASGIVDYVNDYIFDEDLILLGEDGENILSRNLPLAFKVSGKIWVNNHAHVMRPNKDFNITFLTEFLESLDYSLLNSGSAQPKLNKASCLKIRVVKPSKQEQTAIATALSDVDNLIQSLEKLIAKKESIKTATMQQLLTGKTRLPEFTTREDGSKKGFKQTDLGHIPEDWELDNIRGISLLPTQNGLFYEPTRKGTGIPLINVSDMYKSAPIQVVYLELFDATPNEISVFKVTAGDLLFTRSSIVPSGIAFCNIFESNRDDVVFDSHLIRVRPNSRIIDPRFLYLNCISNHARTALISEAKTATMTTIDQGAINRCPVLIPPKKEQTAIATTLSDMDAEIQALNARLAKTQDIKQGMMQQLLTGKVRLVNKVS